MGPFVGDISQVPSSVSAIKINGERAYARVRAGQDVELRARPVTVRRFEPLELRPGRDGDTPVLDVDVRVTCSSGTYVRALARDLGAALGTAGHLTALRRTRVGPFGLDHAVTLEQLAEAVRVVPMAEAARSTLPVRELTEDETLALGYGRRISVAGFAPGEPVAGFAPDGRLIAVLAEKGSAAVPVIVLAPHT